MSKENFKKIRSLPLWKGEINIESLDGGLTNQNFLVTDISDKYVVRLGEDIPEHLISRSNELISSKAAFEVGISPEIIFNSLGVLVQKYIESKTFSAKDVKENIDRIIPIIKKVHFEIPNKLYGLGIIFWVFHVIKNYAKFLKDKNSPHVNILPELINYSENLEKLSSPYEIIYGHNDLLPGNFLDDGNKLWLIDWEYSGFNSPLFDLGGLASNCDFTKEQEIYLLENYFEKKIDLLLIKKYNAMKSASLLRETMWSMVSEITSKIDFDYSKYTQDNLSKFKKSYENLK
tara:strand:+ start:626 stop:1492 length:867 start_codon:yes stop_codon:yes gene_type:complete